MTDKELLLLSYKKPSVFGQLFERHNKRFLKIAKKSVGSKDEAEDIVQETFVKIYKYGPKFLGSEGNFISWSNMILRNCIISQIKKRKDSVQIEEVEGVLGQSDDYEREESANYISSIFNKLDAAAARILNLRYVLGKSFKEIAKILNIENSAARVRVYRAKKSFMEVYKKFNQYEK